MMESTLAAAAKSMQGELHGSDLRFRGVSTDTRTIEAGELFIAIQGPNFDGGKFVEAAALRDAAAAVVATPVATDLPSITVEDTRLALGQLAASWRQRMPARVVGITGSNGKTTLKELTASCLNQAAKTLATAGNLNNHIGLPLMMLRLSDDDRFAVFEMGANHAGEIAYLASLAQPSVVAITNAGPAHLEGFGSIQGVAEAKGEILQSIPAPDAVVLNADDDYYDYWTTLAPAAEHFSFALDNPATVTAGDIELHEDGSAFALHMPDARVDVRLPLPGRHNVRNACAAAAIGLALGITADQIRRGLETIAPLGGRLAPLHGVRGSRVFDDSYNANPGSVIAAAEFLAMQDGESILVLADMGELGDNTVELHRNVGEAARIAGIDRLLATGKLAQYIVDAFGDGGQWFATADEVINELENSVNPNSNVLVKGSRSMHMGRVVRAIQYRDDELKAGD